MKKIIVSLVAMLFVGTSLVQAQNDLGHLALTAYVPDQIEGLPSIAKSNLKNKLTQIILKNGISDRSFDSRFILTANINVQNKEIIGSAPTMVALVLDITFYVGDGLEGKSFASKSISVKGVGENETKAYLSAVKGINEENADIKALIQKGGAKIVEYYNTRCDLIVREAKALENQGSYDEAIWKLMSIPDVCTDCYKKCMDAATPIYRKKIDKECKVKLAEATSIWNAGQNYDAAVRAGEILSTINPDAASYKQVSELSAKIADRIAKIDQREWKLKVDKEFTLENNSIKAIRDIGVAYGNGQPKNVTYKSMW